MTISPIEKLEAARNADAIANLFFIVLLRFIVVLQTELTGSIEQGFFFKIRILHHERTLRR
tara:strand:- start:124 stop:306 length:183 start_codon:yes stop_codon:yes gene_type:complete